jgi:hypothetical protein
MAQRRSNAAIAVALELIANRTDPSEKLYSATIWMRQRVNQGETL